MASNDDLEMAAERERRHPSPATDGDIQEAMSLRYSDRAVVVLQLKNHKFAIYNNLRELCGVIDRLDDTWPPSVWRAPPPPRAAPLEKLQHKLLHAVDLKELGLS